MLLLRDHEQTSLSKSRRDHKLQLIDTQRTRTSLEEEILLQVNKYTLMSQEHYKKHRKKKEQIIVKSTIRNNRLHLVIKEIKSSSLATAILVELVKENLKRMLMMRMYISNVLVDQTLNNQITMSSRQQQTKVLIRDNTYRFK